MFLWLAKLSIVEKFIVFAYWDQLAILHCGWDIQWRFSDSASGTEPGDTGALLEGTDRRSRSSSSVEREHGESSLLQRQQPPDRLPTTPRDSHHYK